MGDECVCFRRFVGLFVCVLTLALVSLLVFAKKSPRPSNKSYRGADVFFSFCVFRPFFFFCSFRGGASPGAKRARATCQELRHLLVFASRNVQQLRSPVFTCSLLGADLISDLFHVNTLPSAPISAMTNDPDPSKRTKYYVHYHGLNRRMDEWIGADRVTKPPSVAKAQGAACE